MLMKYCQMLAMLFSLTFLFFYYGRPSAIILQLMFLYRFSWPIFTKILVTEIYKRWPEIW